MSSESQQARVQRAEERRRKMAEMDAAISSMGINVTHRPGGGGGGEGGGAAVGPGRGRNGGARRGGRASSAGPTPISKCHLLI